MLQQEITKTERMQNNRLHILFLALFMLVYTACEPGETSLTNEEFLREQISWLSDPDRGGRLAGSPEEAETAVYIATLLQESGLLPAGEEETFFQHFPLSGPVASMLGAENRISRNVIAEVTGTRYPERKIIIGAHYDGQGMGGQISMDHGGVPALHPGADDNASGAAGLLWLARHFSENPASHTIRFIFFSGEEMGLLGSRYFVETHRENLDQVLAMINLDMIGRLTDGNLTLFGTGTSNVWEHLLDQVSVDSLTVSRVETGSGSSDHTSFYDAGVPVLHYFTGAHTDYHTPADTPDLINYSGIRVVLNHVVELISGLDVLDRSEIEFRESTDPRRQSVMSGGVTLGVLPDYSYSGFGFRIDGVRAGQPAELAGLQRGDTIIRMGDREISDIYSYMEALQTFEAGDELLLLAVREGEEMEFFIIF